MTPKPLTYDRAIGLMRRPGTRLLHMHGRGGGWFVVPPGVPVSDATAVKIQAHPLVKSGKDGLWIGHDQTWRMTS